MSRRPRLDREAVVQAAVELLDGEGVGSLSLGRLAERLELLAQPRVDVLSLITAPTPLSQARDAISRSASGLKVLLTFA